MGLNTQAVLPRHLTIDKIRDRLAQLDGIQHVLVRGTHQPDYSIIEFVDRLGQGRVLDVFLNSYAADDYRDLTDGDCTMLSIEFGPTSDEVIRGIVGITGGWIRSPDSTPWVPVPGGLVPRTIVA